ncbi:SprT-like family-domain-containing protein [Staphylotrichum tortipilum]|uniref:SprT-like family-domain-containing protein n=1 Tax=Staphylotrichum tortipilum TaxID=2831512 RepID=A0AAN6MFZ1_9PEZI|nr:SprT-like family-domain-containing protein [Staphylotrichum longicolle]
MTRTAKPSTIWSDDGDEFPDLDALISRKKTTTQVQARKDAQTPRPKPAPCQMVDGLAAPATVRRRKLGPLTDNLLLRAWKPDSEAEEGEENRPLFQEEEVTRPRRARIELRTRTVKPAVIVPSSPAGQDETYVSAREEVTVIEEASIFDDTFHSCGSEGSEFDIHEDDEEDEDFVAEYIPRAPATKPQARPQVNKRAGCVNRKTAPSNPPEEEDDEDDEPRLPARRRPAARKAAQDAAEEKAKDLADTLSQLRLDEPKQKPSRTRKAKPSKPEATPPSTPPKSRPGLVSPKKLSRIPVTPHRPNSDMFWSQEFVDDWNDEHSPRKQLFPDAAAARQKSPLKDSPEKKPTKGAAAAKTASDREAKKAFEQTKHALASSFLHELDTTITSGQLATLSASTGGIRLVWTNKLNTTAGRANWKRETIRPRDPTSTVTIKHHASIELAEKVITTAPRLLNVLAHEFCHLATFMLDGVTTNPHGREFKAWAARCSAAFGDSQGIEVTTKHTYDIDFRYAWECDECGVLYKRHSKSIDPSRHRCGRCKGGLRQVKPVPRKGKGDAGEGGDEKGKGKGVSEYQMFVKEQMRVVKGENPGSPQKEIMRIVAGRWAERKAAAAAGKGDVKEDVDEVADGLEELAL